jgi:thymidine phosphorylase
MFLPQEIIRRKRDGETLSSNEIEFFIDALTQNKVSDGQAAAFAMAVYFQGMRAQECAALTRAMTSSGRVLDWSGEFLGGPVLDKLTKLG